MPWADDRRVRQLMAIMVPDSCPTKATVGEKRLYYYSVKICQIECIYESNWMPTGLVFQGFRWN